jgi:ADP-heptose:LPS heptosyltransferase
MIVNILPGTFGGPLRNGDLIGVANVIEHLRKFTPGLKFYLDPKAIHSEKYVQEFYKFLLETTEYFSDKPNTQNETLKWQRVNLWDFRDICGDLVKIPNTTPMEKKIVVFPLTDAPYNTYRNWPMDVVRKVFDRFDSLEYKDYKKVICHKDDSFRRNGWHNSTNFMDNIHHIMSAEVFCGGDTGTSHFAFALDRGPKDLIYYNSSRALIHTLPFYLMKGKGTFETYWLDFEGTKWN